MNTYNIHPILVHFPIAFFFIYSIVKVLPFRKWFPAVAWKDIERLLLVVGMLGAFAALATGDTAEHLTHRSRAIVEMHSNFAAISVFIYAVILAGEVVAIFNKSFAPKLKLHPRITEFLTLVEKILCNQAFTVTLAILGFIGIFVTGLLGGAMVYGATADPFAPFVLKLLGLSV